MQKETVGSGSPGASVTLDRCGHCGALWLDKGELNRLIEMKAARRADIGPFRNERSVTPLGSICCPRDGEILVEAPDRQQRHILIMYCPSCAGKLLDAGELIDLQEFTFVERLRATLGLA